jgi:hypothetical protein
MIKCEICGREFKSIRSIAQHFRNIHDISQKEYYDKYLKKENEGICSVCGKPARFSSIIKGYDKTCCQKCTVFDRYGVWNASQSEEIKQKKIDTCRKNYGVDYNFQRKETIAKSHSDEIIKKQSKSRKRTLKQKYGVENSYLIEDVVRRTYDSTKSKSEKYFEDRLKECDIKFVAQYKDEKYPHYCDFYLPEYDCYIELNIFWSHHQGWFNSKDKNCKKKLKHLQDKIDSTSGETSKFYKRSLETWTEVDLEKREVARDNNLNYKVFWTQEEIKEFFEDFSTEKLKNNRDYE